jgi:hypothetical protein
MSIRGSFSCILYNIGTCRSVNAGDKNKQRTKMNRIDSCGRVLAEARFRVNRHRPGWSLEEGIGAPIMSLGEIFALREMRLSVSDWCARCRWALPTEWRGESWYTGWYGMGD